MDVLLSCASGATVGQVRSRLPEAPSYSAVRALLRVMEEKGLLTHTNDGGAYVYRPVISPKRARASMLKQLLATFFNGSREQLVAALLDEGEMRASPEELERLERMIREARQQGR